MTPDTKTIVSDLAARMGMVFAPDLKTPYLAGSAGMTAAVLMMVAEETDRAADRLADENRAIREILKDAASVLPPAELTERAALLVMAEDESLRVSALQAANNLLRTALTDLQAHVETRADAASKAMNDAIWAELSASTRRRAFAVGF